MQYSNEIIRSSSSSGGLYQGVGIGIDIRRGRAHRAKRAIGAVFVAAPMRGVYVGCTLNNATATNLNSSTRVARPSLHLSIDCTWHIYIFEAGSNCSRREPNLGRTNAGRRNMGSLGLEMPGLHTVILPHARICQRASYHMRQHAHRMQSMPKPKCDEDKHLSAVQNPML